MNAIALDDEPIALQIIEAFANQLPNLVLERTFTKVGEAKKYLSRYPVDLIFLDINMPEMNGIEFWDKVPKHTMVIFTTAYDEYAVKGFELNAVDYLLKPFSFDRFNQAFEKALEVRRTKCNVEDNHPSQIHIRADYQLMTLNTDSIELIESLADYIKIKLIGNKSITVRMTMKAFMEKLPTEKFIRVHRSYIVPIKRIQSIRNKVIYLDDMEIQIGHSYEDVVANRFSI